MKVLILGATGLVGGEVLRLALADSRVESAIAPTRRNLTMHPKLSNPTPVDLSSLLGDAASWKIDAVVCAMGTTIGKAGSKEAFRNVDYVLPLSFAQLAYENGARGFAL